MSQNRIDLSEINKTNKPGRTKTTNSLKPSTHRKLSDLFGFKNQSGVRRDNEGKFTSGSGGLLKGKKFNWKRAAPIIVVVSLVGGFFVFKSFAATPKYAYQYSVHSCKGFTNKSKPDQNCIDKSAEAVIFRLYETILNRKPDAGAYKYWTQQMVGGTKTGRTKRSQVAKFLLASKEAKRPPGVVYGIRNNRDLIRNVWKSTFGSVDQKTIDFLVKVKEDRKWSREQYMEAYVGSELVIKELRSDFAKNSTVSATLNLKIDPVAKKAQAQRVLAAKWVNADSRRAVANLARGTRDNQNRNKAAWMLANRNNSQIKRSDLDVIKYNYINVIKARARQWQTLSQFKPRVERNLKYVNAQYAASLRVTQYSPDISSNPIKAEFENAEYQKRQANRYIANANWLVGQSTNAYNFARKKYEAHQRYIQKLKEINACNNRANHKWQGGLNGYCKYIPPAPAPAPSGGSGGGGGGNSGGGGSGGGGNSGGGGSGGGGGGNSGGGVSLIHVIPDRTPSCSANGQQIRTHGLYYSCHLYGDKKYTGFLPKRSSFKCRRGYYIKSTRASATRDNAYWQGYICRRNGS